MNNNAILTLDIGTTKTIAIVAQNNLNNRINILGVGNNKSTGINKGSIVDIDLVSKTILETIETAKQSSNVTIESTFVSLSGVDTKSLRSSGTINIQSGQISYNEIHQVLRMALHNANLIPEYEAIHVLPLYFKIDDSNEINNPLNMNGSRLEVYVNIITAKRNTLVNIQNTLKTSNIDITNFVLNSYASALAVLTDDQKKLGTVVFDLGGSTSELSIFKGSTIHYNDFIEIGSEHITSDLSILLHTPYDAANMIKNQYGSLLSTTQDETNLEQSPISKVKIPVLGSEDETNEIPLVQIQPIIHARCEELLFLLKDKLYKSGITEQIDGGIIITGGMSQIKGFKELAQQVFPNFPVEISNPISIQNGYIDFNTPSLSTTAGLLKYALDTDPFFELDSNQALRQKIEIQQPKTEEESQDTQQSEGLKEIIITNDDTPKKSFWDKIGKWL